MLKIKKLIEVYMYKIIGEIFWILLDDYIKNMIDYLFKKDKSRKEYFRK